MVSRLKVPSELLIRLKASAGPMLDDTPTDESVYEADKY